MLRVKQRCLTFTAASRSGQSTRADIEYLCKMIFEANESKARRADGVKISRGDISDSPHESQVRVLLNVQPMTQEYTGKAQCESDSACYFGWAPNHMMRGCAGLISCYSSKACQQTDLTAKLEELTTVEEDLDSV